MYCLRAIIALVTSLLCGSLAWAQQTIPVSIVSRASARVPEFTNANFEASYKGGVVQVKSIIREKGPRRVVLLLDVSGSMLGDTIDADWNFPLDVAEVLLVKMPPGAEIGMAVFATEMEHVVGLTNDHKKLMDEMEVVRKSRREFGDRDTALWDSMIAASKLIEHPGPGDALYVITDGLDNKSKATSGNVVQALACQGIRVFPFALADRRHFDGNLRPKTSSALRQLTEIAEDTGGMAAVALRPSTVEYHKWDFVDKSGNPTPLTNSLFAQYVSILDAYGLSIELPKPLDKPNDWYLDFAGLSTDVKSDLMLRYPRKLEPCNHP